MIPPVPARKTPLVPADVWDALVAAWPDAPPNAVAVLMAQIGLETAWKDCVCFNLGNVKASGEVPWCSFPTWEIINGRRVELAAGDPGARFRAFDSLEEGVRFYLDLMKKRFTHAWPAVLAGDPHEFARLLREQRYYTAPLADYQSGMQAIFDRWADPPLGTRQQIGDALAKLGFDVSDFKHAVMLFQKARGLFVDGDPGPITRRELRDSGVIDDNDESEETKTV